MNMTKKLLAGAMALTLTIGSLSLPTSAIRFLPMNSHLSASAEEDYDDYYDEDYDDYDEYDDYDDYDDEDYDDYDDEDEYNDDEDEDDNTDNGDDLTFGDYKYEILDDGNIEITGYSGSEVEIEIPSEIQGKKVTKIGDWAFYECEHLISIVIPDSVTSIGESAFWKCENLKSLTLPKSITRIEDWTFCNCQSLTNITIPSSVTSLGFNAFYGCSNLKTITIPDSVTDIGTYTFRDCSNLSNVTISNNVTIIGEYVFENCQSLKSIIIPNSVTQIGDSAFYNCTSLTSIKIPNSITSIGENSFYNTGILNNQKTDVKYIDSWAVDCNKNAVSVSIKSGTVGIADQTFVGEYDERTDKYDTYTSLNIVEIPNSVKYVGSYAFYGCSHLKSITIPDSVISIAGGAFLDCSSLTSVTISSSVMSVGSDAFRGTALLDNQKSNIKYVDKWVVECSSNETSVLIKDGTIGIADGVFANHSPYEESNLKSIQIPSSVKYIGNYSFSLCSNLKSITIGNGVTSIGDSAFYNCTSLTGITIPKSVSSIGDKAFGYYLYDTTDDWYDEKVNGFKINCYPGTAGEKYAKDNGFDYELLDAPAHEHSYTSKVTKAATCTETGIRIYTCSCGDSYTETVPAVGHKFGAWTVTKKATCTTTGTQTRKCSVCGATETKAIPKTAHTYKKYTTKATLTKNGSIVEKCSVCGAKKSTTVIYYPKTIALAKTSYVYNGKVQKPAVTVKDAKGKVIAKSNYTVTYSSGCKNVGKYAVKITFKGNYSGTKTLNYTIVPKGTSISKLTAGKKSFTAKWVKNATQTTGYQIQYTTDSKFKSGVKTVTINKNTTVSKAISKLTGGKKYYVRVRTYRTANKVNYFSAWSGAKAVTTKK